MAPRDLPSRLRDATQALGPQQQPVSQQPGTSYSRVPGQPETKPYRERPSQAVANMSYDYNNKDLFVTYTTGGRYIYKGVPQATYTAFATASSLGWYVNKVIKPQFPVTKA